MNIAIFSYRRVGPRWHMWSCDKAVTVKTRRQALRLAAQWVRIYRRVRVVFYPSKRRVEWRDGRRVS